MGIPTNYIPLEQIPILNSSSIVWMNAITADQDNTPEDFIKIDDETLPTLTEYQTRMLQCIWQDMSPQS